MSKEIYNIGNKERLIETLSSPDFDDRKYYGLYQRELYWTENGNNSLDFLEILPWDRLGKVSYLIYCLSPDINGDQRVPKKGHSSEYVQYSKSRVADFLMNMHIFLNTVDITNKARLYLQKSRKVFGMISSHEEILQASEALFLAFNSGLFPNDELVLFQYPGTFLPFPHKAHLELTEKSFETLTQADTTEKRIVVSTFLKNSYRHEKNPPFPYRIDLLRRGFGLQDFVTVLGIGGNSDEQHRQMKLVSRLSSDGIINYLCGSDTIIKKVELATRGDRRAIVLFGKNIKFFISIRPGENMEKLRLACEQAKRFGSEVLILTGREVDISGTAIREIGINLEGVDHFFPNSFVREVFDK